MTVEIQQHINSLMESHTNSLSLSIVDDNPKLHGFSRSSSMPRLLRRSSATYTTCMRRSSMPSAPSGERNDEFNVNLSLHLRELHESQDAMGTLPIVFDNPKLHVKSCTKLSWQSHLPNSISAPVLDKFRGHRSGVSKRSGLPAMCRWDVGSCNGITNSSQSGPRVGTAVRREASSGGPKMVARHKASRMIDMGLSVVASSSEPALHRIKTSRLAQNVVRETQNATWDQPPSELMSGLATHRSRKPGLSKLSKLDASTKPNMKLSAMTGFFESSEPKCRWSIQKHNSESNLKYPRRSNHA